MILNNKGLINNKIVFEFGNLLRNGFSKETNQRGTKCYRKRQYFIQQFSSLAQILEVFCLARYAKSEQIGEK